MGIIASIIVGAISGFLAGKFMNSNFRTLESIGIGILGGAVGNILFSLIGLYSHGFIGSIIVSVVGACALIALVRAIRR